MFLPPLLKSPQYVPSYHPGDWETNREREVLTSVRQAGTEYYDDELRFYQGL